MSRQLEYIIGRGPTPESRKRWDRMVCRAAAWKARIRGAYEIQNQIIANAESGEYRRGHVVIQRGASS